MSNRTKEFWRPIFEEIENQQKVFICLECVGDPILKRLNSDLQRERICAVCRNPTKNALTPDQIARFIKKYLPLHFRIDFGSHPGREIALEEVVKNAILCEDNSVCELIARHLVDSEACEDDFYFGGQMYDRKPSPFESEEHERWYVVGEWEHVALGLAHGQRFFNQVADEFFTGILDEALSAKSSTGQPSAIRKVPTDFIFYRARLLDHNRNIKKIFDDPIKELGAPPIDQAGHNRMNPAGIPLLYVAGEIETCIAEIRPSIGDEVVVGTFTTTAELNFFDFSGLDQGLLHSPLSLFDASFRKRTERRILLSYLHEEIARPVRAGDTDYIITQALAEFIRFRTNQKFDGIIYRSVQRAGGLNYVLFGENANLDAIKISDWRPSFDVKIDKKPATYKVESVAYTSIPSGEYPK